ncbi:MAG: hypothetical protein HZB51_25040 [Chloroflexi bacterium]|nr:hypothetical protein [Chloroflexota bacterium]
MENFAIWVLVGDTLLGTLIFIGFALAVKGLAGELDVEVPQVKPVETPKTVLHKP